MPRGGSFSANKNLLNFSSVTHSNLIYYLHTTGIDSFVDDSTEIEATKLSIVIVYGCYALVAFNTMASINISSH